MWYLGFVYHSPIHISDKILPKLYETLCCYLEVSLHGERALKRSQLMV